MSGRDRGASNHEARVTIPLLVMAGDKREARLRARCPGHPRLSCGDKARTWMPGTSPGTTVKARRAEFVEADQADLGCPVPFAKTFRFRSDPNQKYIRAIPSHMRGVSRSSRTLGTGCDGR